MTPLDYNCKICSKPGVAYYDPACEIKFLELWRTALCCQRCYDFRDNYNKLKRSIEKLCVGLINMRKTSSKSKSEVETKIREMLTTITKKLSGICSDFYRVQNIWDFEIVSILMDNPDGCNRAINVMRSTYQNLSQTDRSF